MKLFWDLAKEGQSQTEAFIESDGPEHAVRVFDFAMTVADLNNLVHLTAQSKDSQGRAYSAGFTNAGVYERLDSFEKEQDDTRAPIKVGHLYCWMFCSPRTRRFFVLTRYYLRYRMSMANTKLKIYFMPLLMQGLDAFIASLV